MSGVVTRAQTRQFELESRPLIKQTTSIPIQGRVVKPQATLLTHENILRAYNALISVSVFAICFFSERIENPYQYLFDATIHGLQACVTRNSSEKFRTIIAHLNRIRIAQLLIYPPANQSGWVSFGDIVNHGVNVAVIEGFKEL